MTGHHENLSRLIDTHCHVDLFKDPPALIRSVEAHGIYTIAVTNTPSVFPPMQKLTKASDFIRPALGLHPELVSSRSSELPLMWQHFDKTRYIGEIGLDYSDQSTETALQRRVFQEIVERCHKHGDKILTVHSRKAEKDVVDTIGPSFNGKVILHWYSGNIATLRKAVEYGFYFSINVAMARSKRFHNLAKIIPLDRILTESDGPFVKVSGVAAQPSSVADTFQSLASAYSTEPSIIREHVFSNFRQLLKPKERNEEIG